MIFRRGPRGSGMEARPQGQGRVGWGAVGWGGVQGRANHPLMGNTLFLHRLNCPFYSSGERWRASSRGLVSRSKARILNQELSHATIPGCCDGDNQEPCKNKCGSKPRHKGRERNGSQSYQGLLPPLRVQVSSSVAELPAIRATMEGKKTSVGAVSGGKIPLLLPVHF